MACLLVWGERHWMSLSDRVGVREHSVVARAGARRAGGVSPPPFPPTICLLSSLLSSPKLSMILSVLIFNTTGVPRLSKFYTPTPPATQRSLIAAIFSLVAERPAGGAVCSFLDAPELREGFGEDARVVYR